jgi:hypothetical protein
MMKKFLSGIERFDEADVAVDSFTLDLVSSEGSIEEGQDNSVSV